MKSIKQYRLSHVSDERLDQTLKVMQSTVKTERDKWFSIDMLERALFEWLDLEMELIAEDLPDRLGRPGPSLDRLEHILDNMASAADEVHPAPAFALAVSDTAIPTPPSAHSVFQQRLFDTEPNVYNGNQPFSFEKLAAMVEHLTFRMGQAFETNLNKLLFYSDLSFYYLTKRGMSGTPYIKHQYGPVPEGYENVLSHLTRRRRIRHKNVTIRGEDRHVILAKKTYKPDTSGLSVDEIKLLDWVVDTYGGYSPSEISDLSHQEKAYKFTQWQKHVAYEYAKHLQTLPPKDLLTHQP